jgi:hypothetical protein
MSQTEIPVPPPAELPPLPEPPLYWPSTTSTYTRTAFRSRVRCDVCVLLAHSGHDLHGPPRAARYSRRGPIAREKPLRLCDTHRRQYLARDNDARRKAGVKPLAGEG